MKILTLDELKEMEPETIFANGETEIENPWYGQADEPECKDKIVKVNWIAIRGVIHDWAIYHSWDYILMLYGGDHLKVSDDKIASHGAKLHDEEKVRELVLCTDEAFEMYRH